MSLNPYAAALGNLDPVAVLRETRERCQAVFAALSAEAIDRRPAPGAWSFREVLAHLADCELAFGFRLRQAYAGQPMVQPFDQDAWSRPYAVYTADRALTTFFALRAWNLDLIESLTPADKLLPVTHPERGDMQLWTIVETMAGHDLHHFRKAQSSLS